MTIAIEPDPITGGNANSVGDHFEVRGTYTGPSSYTTGGEAITAQDFGPYYTLLDLILEPTGAEVLKWDRDNGKIMIYTADGTQATNASDQDAVVSRFIAKVK